MLDQASLADAPRIVATQQGRLLVSRGETAYVLGDLGEMRSFALLRQGKPLRDPESGELLGHEAGFVGTADLVRAQSSAGGLPVPATLLMTSARQEAGVGDRLVQLPPRDFASYAPHAPAASMQGRVIATRDGLRETGPQNVVTLNQGKSDGLEPGHVLALLRLGRSNQEKTPSGKWFGADKIESTKLPDERYGLVFVFRVFDRVSYALVMSATRPVQIGDVVTTP